MNPSKLKESDFRNYSSELLKDENLVKFFRNYGISVESLRFLLIGKDEEGNVVAPIYNNNNIIQGKLTIHDIFVNGGLYQFSAYGLVGNAKSENKEITIAKNIIDVLLLWQLGIDNPVMVSDREQAPFLDKYSIFYFIDNEDDLLDMVAGQRLTYNIKDLVNYLSMYKELPTPEKLPEKFFDREPYTCPFVIKDKLYIPTNIRGNLLGQDGDYKATRRYSKSHRSIKIEDFTAYYSGDPWTIPANYKVEKALPMKELYEKLFEIIYGHFSFASEDQCKVIAIFLLYQWTFYYKYPLKMHLHIIDPSYFQADVMYQILRMLTPGTYPGSNAPTTIIRQGTEHIFYTYPNIYIDKCGHDGNFDIGPKIVITEGSCEHRKTPALRRGLTKVKEFRSKLLDATFGHQYEPLPDMNIASYAYFMFFHQVGQKCEIELPELKKLFMNVVVKGHKFFRGCDKEDYRMNHSTKLDEDL